MVEKMPANKPGLAIQASIRLLNKPENLKEI